MPTYDPNAFPTYSASGNPMDPNAINQALQQNYAALGVSPTGVGSGPTDISYYANAIQNSGGLNQSNWNYWFGPQGRVASDVGGGGGGGGGGGMGGGSNPTYPFSSPFQGQAQMPSMATPAPYTPPPAFQMPTPDQVAQMPGYQFNLQQGLGAISNSAAAQGLWQSGATGKAMDQYSQGLANTYYNDYFNQALQTYGTNLQSQYVQPYEMNYQGQYQIPYGLNIQAQNQSFQNQLALWQDYFNQKYMTGNFLSGYIQA